MIDHPAWVALQEHVTRNLPEYITFAAALGIAIVCTMPENPPSTLRDWWTWMRNSLQTAVPAARARHEASSSVVTSTPTASTKQEASTSTALDPPAVPIQPAEPAQPKQGA